MKRICVMVMTLLMIVACSRSVPAKSNESELVRIFITCPKLPSVPNASYVGEYLGVENNLTAVDFARDVYCSDQFKSSKYPRGYVTIMGSSKIGEQEQVYGEITDFAYEWTRKKLGATFPIMTGGGPGIMAAGSLGAMRAIREAKQQFPNQAHNLSSIGYTTYYDKAKDPETDCLGAGKKYCGDATLAFFKDKEGELISD
ncbi:MAG: hypothetical protein K2P84_13115, partial [Undibacterium sp.]|nr:hypothetical protein [Undibacterium sp.]